MNNKKKTIIIVALLLVVFIGSISYALWSVTLEQTDSNIVKTGCFTVDMVEETDEINLPEEYPVTDEEGRKYSPFTFTIQNTCTIDSSYSVNLDVDAATTLGHEYVKVSLNNNAIRVLTDYEKATNEDKYQLTTGTLAGASAEGAGDGESVTYNLRLWLDENTPKSQMSKDFYAKIVIENITTSGVIARKVIATGDISATADDNVTYKFYTDGLLTIEGTGNMIDFEDGGIAVNIIDNVFQSQCLKESINCTQFLDEIGDKAWIYGIYNNYGTVVNWVETTFTDPDDEMNINNLKNQGITTDIQILSYLTGVDFEDVSEVEKCIQILQNIKIDSIKEIIISEGVNNVGSQFVYCSYDDFDSVISYIGQSFVFSNTIENIGAYAFAESILTEIKLNDGLKSIGESAFKDSQLNGYLEIPDSVEKISKHAFGGTEISGLKLPQNDKYVGNETDVGICRGCNNLLQVELPINVVVLGNPSSRRDLIWGGDYPEGATYIMAVSKANYGKNNYRVYYGFDDVGDYNVLPNTSIIIEWPLVGGNGSQGS